MTQERSAYMLKMNILGLPVELGIELLRIFTKQEKQITFPPGVNRTEMYVGGVRVSETVKERKGYTEGFFEHVKKHLSGLTPVIYITTKEILVDNQSVKLILALVSPSKIYQRLRQNFYRGAGAALIFFDKKDSHSLSFAEQGCNEFRTTINYSTPVALVGIQSNTAVIKTEQGQVLASKCKSSYYEITCSDYKQVEDVFLDLTYKVLQKIQQQEFM